MHFVGIFLRRRKEWDLKENVILKTSGNKECFPRIHLHVNSNCGCHKYIVQCWMRREASRRKKIFRKWGKGKCSLYHSSIYNCNSLQLNCVKLLVMADGCQREEQQCTLPQQLLEVMKEQIWLREYLISTVTAKADLQVPSQSLLAET